ncbi:large ribosomal subunit protein mL46 [Austrofundulus limnaeus]|uniref:Large ribosomal subunit protein mL46 n=1 Tax=Austrofundulus limnaeus TaxID=52670 RepID=A0A2I4BTH9_AUSLI|nr:PREDICTED: 39S ribosomal protein L46, mitochondrial [Austrofundulus limnaeus]
MAAPCRRMASRTLWKVLSHFSRTGVRIEGCRHFSITPIRGQTLRTKPGTEKASSPWALMAAVYLQRLPVVSADFSPLEQRFKDMLQQMELEKSLLSDHEVRLLEDADKMSRKQAGDYDLDDDESDDEQDIILAQDLEDAWEQKFQNFQKAPRVVADVDKDLTSVERCLADSLVLLAQQQMGGEKLWLLPQAPWQEGETLRQTAEKALATVTDGFKVTFLSNAPCGVYKYKLPRAARTESLVGSKVFFFKAILEDRTLAKDPNAALLWLKKSELQQYLKPAYMTKVDPFIISL